MTRVVHSSLWSKILTFFVIFGPGLITLEADNDAGAVAAYTQAGAHYGMGLIWVLLLLLPITYFVQEMSARLGIITGKGFALMIYKKFGRWWGAFSLAELLVVNFLTLVTEFAAISLIMSKFGLSPYWSVPAVGIGLIALVCTTNYNKWERSMIVLCLVDLSWIVLAIMHRGQLVASATPAVVINSDLIFLIVAIIGTTVAPWQLFFQQSCVSEKKLRFKDLKYERLETFIGAIFTILVAACMMFCGAVVGKGYTDPAQMAVVLSKSWGCLAGNILLIMFCNAAILGTVAISLSSAWAYGEVKGWPCSLQLRWKDAPAFYGIYVACVMLAAGVVLIPHMPLQFVIVGVQVIAGVMLPSLLIFLHILLNDKTLMGEHANKLWNNIINWLVIGLLTVLSLILAGQVLIGTVHTS